MYLSRQLYEEALHVQFYLTLLDTYMPDHDERAEAFAADREHPVDPGQGRVLLQVDRLDQRARRAAHAPRTASTFLLNLICFAACIEGLFFFGAFAYVYFLRSKGLLNGLAAGTNWVFRDESGHMDFAFAVIDTVRARGARPVRRRPRRAGRGDDRRGRRGRDAVRRRHAVARACPACRPPTPASTCSSSPTSASCASACRSASARKNPFGFMELQDVQELSNFFERTVSAYQVGVAGDVAFDEDF